MSPSIDLEAGWVRLAVEPSCPLATFRDSPACRAVFDRIPRILGDLAEEPTTPENIWRARMRIVLHAESADLLHEDGYRFAEPPTKDAAFPFLLCVNGDRAQRDAVIRDTEGKLTIAEALTTYPKLLVWFERR